MSGELEEPTPCPECGDVVELQIMRSRGGILRCPDCTDAIDRESECDQCHGSGRFTYEPSGLNMACDACGGDGCAK